MLEIVQNRKVVYKSWAPNYQNSYAYQDANYGYNGHYIAQDDYNYYFRQGFQRG